MSTKQYKKLIMVTGENNNKYYEMKWDGVSSNFKVVYGRVESTAAEETYPISRWNSKYNEKIRRGYKDVTDFVTVQVAQNQVVDSKLAATGDSKVDEFLALMKRYTDNLVSTTYSVTAVNVTQKQIDEAQTIINSLTAVLKTSDKVTGLSVAETDTANFLLTQLYTTIPRRMRNVKDHLLPRIILAKSLEQEQDNLDAMASQVAQIAPKQTKAASKKVKNLLDVMGITMKHIPDGNGFMEATKELGYLLNQRHGKKVAAVFECNKPEEDKSIAEWMKDKKNKTTKILIHGTRCSSVIPILEQSLKIRPAGNYQFSGKVYGDGNYFSEVVQKSLNYTGNDNDKILLVYEVHTGNPFVYDGWYRGNSFSLTLNELQKRGYDSTYVKAGNGLLNSEIIAYSEKQNRIKYIIWLKN